MNMKRKRSSKKTIPKKPTNVVGNNEEAFLETQNTKENSGSIESSDGNDSDEFDSETKSSMLSSSSSSSSSSGSDESYEVEDSSPDESSVDTRVRSKAMQKTRNSSKKSENVKVKSSRGLSSSSRKGKKSKTPWKDPQYNKKQLKAALVVIKKVMEMDGAQPFNAPVDPVALGLPDYFDVIDTPMDFGTICSSLQNGIKYMNSEDVFKDVQCIWENCRKYNNKGDYIWDLMKHVKKKFRKYWTAAGLYSEQPRKTSDYAMRHSRCEHMCPVDPVIGNLSWMQQDKMGPSMLQPERTPSSYNHPYQSQQPQPSTIQLQFSQNQGGADNTTAGHTHLLPTDFSMKSNKYVPRFPVGAKIGGASPSQPQQPQMGYNEPYHMQQPQQSTSQPAQAAATIGNADCATSCNGCVPRCPVDPMAVNCSQMHPQQPPHSHGQSYESQQPQASIGQQQPSQLPASVNIGSAGHSHLLHMDSAMRGSGCAMKGTVGPVSDNASRQQQVQFGPSQSQPQQPSQSHSQPHHSQQPTRKKKRGRGPNRLCYLWDMHDGERIFVPINKLGQPVGPESAKLSNFLGTIARDGCMAPLTFVHWKAMPDAKKEDMWQYVQTKFDVDPRCKSWVMKSLGRKFSNWKAELKANHYYPHKTDEERLKDLDMRVVPDQWPILIAFWNSEKEKMHSATNRANRAKLKGATHAVGRKSFARIREEEQAKRPDGKEPTRAEVYIITHTRKDGQPVDETAAVTISKLRQQASQKQKTSQGSNDWDDTFFQVMGEERKSRVRTYGLGPTHSDIWGPRPSHGQLMTMTSEAKRSADKEVSKVLEKMEAMEKKYAQMEAHMARMTSNMQKLLDKIGATSKNLEVPGTSNAPDDSL